MVNYACGFNQSETVKYFEWIIVIDIIWNRLTLLEKIKTKIILTNYLHGIKSTRKSQWKFVALKFLQFPSQKDWGSLWSLAAFSSSLKSNLFMVNTGDSMTHELSTICKETQLKYFKCITQNLSDISIYLPFTLTRSNVTIHPEVLEWITENYKTLRLLFESLHKGQSQAQRRSL